MKLYCSLGITLVLGLLSICGVDQQDNMNGNWKGTSICQVKNSPCHDETAIYHAVNTEGKTYRFQMNKMAGNKEVDG
jgi:hypothetical protein